jgi:hypothetical protein
MSVIARRLLVNEAISKRVREIASHTALAMTELLL